MRVLIQRVTHARVSVDGVNVAEIGRGMLIFVGIGKCDAPEDIDYLCRKIANLRIFEDEKGKMNLNIQQIQGEILSISQFTLYADMRKGNRPGFDQSAHPDTARDFWLKLNSMMKECGIRVKEGIFGAKMKIDLVNDGPVTFWLDSQRSQ